MHQNFSYTQNTKKSQFFNCFVSKRPAPDIKQLSPLLGFIHLFSSLIFLFSMQVQAVEPHVLEEGVREFMRQQEREQDIRSHYEQRPEVRLDRSQPQTLERGVDEVCFVINRLVLVGDESKRFNNLLKNIELNGAPVEGQCLGVQSILTVLDSLQNKIIEQGYVTTRVVIGSQDLKSGILEIRLIEGLTGDINFIGEPRPYFISNNMIAVRRNQLLNLRDIEQSLENLQRLPSLTVAIDLEPGEELGRSNLNIKAQQARRIRADLSLNDSGSKSTGIYQGGATLFLDNPLFMADMVYISLTESLGGANDASNNSRGYVAHYSAPYGYWLMSLTGSANSYDQKVQGLNNTYTYSGDSESYSLDLDYLFYRDATRKISARASIRHRESSNYIDDTEVDVQRRKTTRWAMKVNYLQYLQAGKFDFSFEYSRGSKALNAISAPEEAFGSGYTKAEIYSLQASYDTYFELMERNYLYRLVFRSQWTPEPLIPQDRFNIGSRYTVRGFERNISASADKGMLLRNELSNRIFSFADAYMGMDAGILGGNPYKYQSRQWMLGSVFGVRGRVKGIDYDFFMGSGLAATTGIEKHEINGGFSFNYGF